jgi:hypothetical protein
MARRRGRNAHRAPGGWFIAESKLAKGGDMKPRVITPKGKCRFEFDAAMKTALGRCQAFPKFDVDGLPLQCDARAVDVVEEIAPNGTRFIAMCRACRLAGIGSSSTERGQRTKAFKARQNLAFRRPLMRARTEKPMPLIIILRRQATVVPPEVVEAKDEKPLERERWSGLRGQVRGEFSKYGAVP